jgi:hypothetical protein
VKDFNYLTFCSLIFSLIAKRLMIISLANIFTIIYIAAQQNEWLVRALSEINLFVGSHGTIELFETHLFWSNKHETPQ